MLENLHVKNLALIEEEDITFLDGLHILSGETGAGKSIILGALGLALGGKVSKDMLRDPGKEALVEAVFRITRDSQRKQLAELDIEPYDDEVILSRKITESRSVAKINGEMVPAIKMKEVGDIFLDIHGQNDHQSLLHKKKHLEMLDEYAKNEVGPLKERMQTAYKTYATKQQEWKEANQLDGDREREISFLEYEIKEITEANLEIGEDARFENQYRRLSNSKRIMEALSEAYQQTSGSDGASEQVGRAVQRLHQILSYDEALEPMFESLNDIDSLLSDFNRDLSQYMAETEFDEEMFAQIDGRLNEINRLKDKYGATIEDILAAKQEKEDRLEKLMHHEAYLAKLTQALNDAKKEAEDAAFALSGMRKRYAKELSGKVEEALMDLNFLDVHFSMEFLQTDHIGADGYDDAQFMIRTNPGEPIRPLKDIASGGEMSRIMLAIKTVLAEHDDIDTLIFDEIDAGISGRTAQAVSEKLHLVAKEHQVICITHLPQIAAMADHHYLIQKDVVGNETISSIEALSYHDSIKELARMLGGTTITQTVLDNAKEMKDLAQGKKDV
ncbi:DNA repair protein RecN [Roseburia sp. AM16-25]|uniref:DNA repair protein RecN n=1 Tax=Roseburia sp. AM16-25 TaxID=2292065 RepID=UPI000E5097CE|nr:DNA repair protein RecN [Roseburia sp. AM16-25]RHO29981.1 DNA repair protein RecN [Roseburia sp. AM16-25]